MFILQQTAALVKGFRDKFHMILPERTAVVEDWRRSGDIGGPPIGCVGLGSAGLPLEMVRE
jgi:hypothetical protein